MTELLYVEFKKKLQTNLFAEEKWTQRLQKTYGYQSGRGGRRDGLGIRNQHMHTEVYGMIYQLGPAYSTGNSIQYYSLFGERV